MARTKKTESAVYRVVVRTPGKEDVLITTTKLREAAKVYNANFGRARLIVDNEDVPICRADRMMENRTHGPSISIEPKKTIEGHDKHRLKAAR